MVRKSIDFSQSLLRFQGQPNMNDRQVEKPEIECIVVEEGPDAEEVDNYPRAATKKEHQKHGQKYLNSQEAARMDAIKKKYKLQNMSLAKSNSAMLSRISEMESRISELVNENILLKKTSGDAMAKKTLSENMHKIETNILSKIGDIFAYLRTIRLENGLDINTQFELLEGLNRPVTSTPIEEDGYFSSPPFGLDFSTVDTKKRAQKILEDNSKNQDFQFRDHFKNHNLKKKDYKGQTLVQSSDSSPKRRSALSKKDKMNPNLNDEIRRSPKKSTGSTVIENKSYECIEPTFSEEMDVDDTGRSQYITRGQNRPQEIDQTFIEENSDIIPNDKCSTILEEPETSTRSFDIHKDVSDEPARPRRKRKEVDYTPLPLGAKMRRESDKPLDAVGENVLINYVVKNRRNSEQFQVHKERKPLQDVMNINSSKPFKKVKGNSGKLSDSSTIKSNSQKAIVSNGGDLSMFDFEDTSKGKGRRHTIFS